MRPDLLRKNIRSIIALMFVGFVMLWLLLILLLGYANPAFIDRTTATLFGILGGGIMGFYFASNHTPPNTTTINATESEKSV